MRSPRLIFANDRTVTVMRRMIVKCRALIGHSTAAFEAPHTTLVASKGKNLMPMNLVLGGHSRGALAVQCLVPPGWRKHAPYTKGNFDRLRHLSVMNFPCAGLRRG